MRCWVEFDFIQSTTNAHGHTEPRQCYVILGTNLQQCLSLGMTDTSQVRQDGGGMAGRASWRVRIAARIQCAYHGGPGATRKVDTGKEWEQGPSPPLIDSKQRLREEMSLLTNQRHWEPKSAQALAALCPAESRRGHHPVLLGPGLPATYLL